MQPGEISALRALVNAARVDPALLYDPSLSFFRDYLNSLGATLPPAPANGTRAAGGEVMSLGSVSEWETVLAKGGPAVIDFTATWCPPCKAIKPVFKKLAEENPDISFFAVDVDEAKDLATKYGITAMPTFKFFSDGKLVGEVKGASAPELKAEVAKLASGTSRAMPNAAEDEHVHGPGCSHGHDAEDVENMDDEADEADEDENLQIPPMPVMADEMEGDEEDPDVIPEADRDSPPYPDIGDESVELSEADIEKQMAAKMEASELASAGEHGKALEKWNTVIAMKPSPLTLAKRADVLLKMRRPNAAIADCDAALKMNPDSAKSLKTRGKAYRLLGDWEKASADLSQGNTIDFDEDSAEIQKVVQSHWSKIRDKRNKHAAAMRTWKLEKETIERVAARKKAQREYDAQKTREASRGMPGGMPDMGGGGGMPGIPGLTPEMQEKLKDPKVAAKLSGIFSGLQGGE
jgi:suppressor of tumorigenicity protein 13